VVGVCLDTGWFGTHGYDGAQAIEELAPRLFHIHLKDVRAVGGHDTCRYGEGVVDIRDCVETLKRIGYGGAISIEHEPDLFDPTDDIRSSYEMLKGWLAE
jgi:sugar phosphate isomerase/epimerase